MNGRIVGKALVTSDYSNVGVLCQRQVSKIMNIAGYRQQPGYHIES